MTRRPPPPLTPFEARLALSRCPAGSRITGARFFKHHAYPTPIRVAIRTPGGGTRVLVVRSIRHRKGHLEREVALYPVLARLGLPVPRVLAGPHADPAEAPPRDRIILSLVPGTNLQQLAERGGRNVETAARLVVEAVQRLHALTPAIRRHRVGRLIPRGGLASHLEIIMGKRGGWQREPVFRQASRKLRPVLERIAIPLVFSNGDYQPANFLAHHGRLSGILDFEYAWFEDPLYGFAKYPIYDLRPLAGAGVVRRFLDATGHTERDFAPRLALGCLATLSREIEVRGVVGVRYRRHVLRLLGESLAKL